MQYKLSICIPTFNRADFLAELLESVVHQYTNEVEIVISDNASTDNTEIIVREFQKKYARITFNQSKFNIGPDRNFLKAIELASGEYCCLMGSDDLVFTGGLTSILDVINKNQGLSGFSIGRLMYDISMKKQLSDLDIFPMRTETFYKYSTSEEALVELAVYLSFMSGHIFSLHEWRKYATGDDIKEYYNGIVHLYIFFNIIKSTSSWGLLSKSIIKCRADNDSFLSYGYLNRYKIDLIGFSSASESIFKKNNYVYKKIMSSVFRSLSINRLMSFKSGKVGFIVYTQLFCETFKYYWLHPRFWFVFIPILLLPIYLSEKILYAYLYLKKIIMIR